MIMMTLVTTVLAPLFLVPAFAKGGSGLRSGGSEIAPEPEGPDERVEPVSDAGPPGDA